MKVSSKYRAGALCAAASTLALSAGAFSFPRNASGAEASSKASVLGEVVVTAQKRSENLQMVPIAVTAFTAKLRDQSGIVSAQQQMNFTPGVTYDPSTDHLDIRGVGKVTTYIGTDPGVAIYQDGFYSGGNGYGNGYSPLNATSLETERTEILRGPQGTLYGRNSIGGAVNVISRRPDKEFTAEVRASWNDYVGQTVEGRISGPVTDWLRLSAYAQENDQKHGYFTNVPPHTAPATADFPAATCDNLNFASVEPMKCSDFKGRPGYDGIHHGWLADFQASYDIGPNFEGWVKAVFSNEFSRPNNQTAITPWNPIALTVPSVFYGFQGSQNPGIYNNRVFTANIANSQTIDNKQFITNDTWHGSGFDVKFIGGYWKTDTQYTEDGDAVPDEASKGGVYEPTLGALSGWPGQGVVSPFHPQSGTVADANNLQIFIPDHFEAWSSELDIASTTKGPLQWLVGLYYYNETNRSTFTYQEKYTPQYDHVTDYLFNTQNGCFPVFGPYGPGGSVININSNGGGSCPFGTVAQIFGYGGTVPSTVSNSPGGALDKLFGIHAGPHNGMLYGYNANLAVQSEALFAQFDWHPTDELHFTVGGRYTWDQKQGYEQEIDVFWIPLVATQEEAAALNFPIDPATGKYVTDYVGTSCSSPGSFGIKPYSSTQSCPAHRFLRDSWQAPTGTAGVEWTPNHDTNIYARYNRGYKSGGFNLGALVADSGRVEPEYIDDFEGGWKQNFFDRSLQLNVAAFYYLYHGLQANNETTQNSSPPIQLNELVNIKDSHSWGVELEAKWSPIENLLIGLNYSYLNATNDTACIVTGSIANHDLHETGCYIDSANPLAANVVNGLALTGVNPVGPLIGGAQPQSLKGNPLPYSPSHKVSANISYTFKFQPGDLILAGVWNWHSQFYDNLFSTQEWLVPGGQTTDFRISWIARNAHYEIIGSVSNAFNANVWTAYTTLPPGNAYYAYNALQPPRVFSLEFRYKF